MSVNDLYKKLETFRHRGNSIPEYMHSGIVNYVVYGIQPGDFLTGIITGDLYKAVNYADDTNLPLLAAYAVFFYNYTPSSCWGSKPTMIAWLEAKQEDRDALQLTY